MDALVMQNEPRFSICKIHCNLLEINILYLLPDAEGGEDKIQHVVGRRLASQGIQGPQRAVQIQQNHLVWNAFLIGAVGIR